MRRGLLAIRVTKAIISFLELDREGAKEEIPNDALRAFGTVVFKKCLSNSYIEMDKAKTCEQGSLGFAYIDSTVVISYIV